MPKRTFVSLYTHMCPNDPISPEDPRWDAIRHEMRGIVQANSSQEAGKIIEWWGWDSSGEMYAWIRKARKTWAAWKKRAKDA